MFIKRLFPKTNWKSIWKMNVSSKCHLRNLCYLTYPDNATYQPSKTKPVLFCKIVSDLYLRYFVQTNEPGRRKRETEFNDISLSNKPEIELACRFRKWF